MAEFKPEVSLAFNSCSRGVKKNGTGVSGGTSNGQKTKTKEKKIQKINTIYRTVTQETQ
ncbi:MAG: hypothetical protein IJL20_07755 [Lachnospiraceae bacterium]|nr:hypothetical protein [Lachnospiraceae bacterium]